VSWKAVCLKALKRWSAAHYRLQEAAPNGDRYFLLLCLARAREKTDAQLRPL
jgi:hypothetical protein